MANMRNRANFHLTSAYVRLYSVRDTLSLISEAVTENPAASALYCARFTLDDILNELGDALIVSAMLKAKEATV